jgi:hypothetical protein
MTYGGGGSLARPLSRCVTLQSPNAPSRLLARSLSLLPLVVANARCCCCWSFLFIVAGDSSISTTQVYAHQTLTAKSLDAKTRPAPIVAIWCAGEMARAGTTLANDLPMKWLRCVCVRKCACVCLCVSVHVYARACAFI